MPRDPHPVTLAAAEEVRPLLAGDGDVLALSRVAAMHALLYPTPRPTWRARLVARWRRFTQKGTRHPRALARQKE